MIVVVINLHRYCWKGVAPPGFVSLGMMFTPTNNPPNIQDVRCVPKTWVIPCQTPPVKLWDDTGAGGGKAGSMWVINNMNMVIVVSGHSPPPSEECLEFNSGKFFLEGLDLRGSI